MDVVGLLVALIALAVGALGGAALARARAAVRAASAAAEVARVRAELERERAVGAERLAAAQAAQERLPDLFKALSADTLHAQATQFLQLAEDRLKFTQDKATSELERRRQAVEHLVAPLHETLGKVGVQLQDQERRQVQAQAALLREIQLSREASERLRGETNALVSALRKPQARGQWGELQLRRVVEIAGMLAHCDFDVQVTMRTGAGTVRPDLVVRLAGERRLVVDAKVSLSAFLEAAEAADESVRAERLGAHARHLRAHVDALASKEYWTAFSPAPEFVVLFVPGDAFLAPALDQDPTLLEHAFARRVHIATPTTLISLLRTVAYEWQQAALTDNAREVFELGRELYKRLGTFGGHVDRLGRALGSAVGHYNSAVGSLERTVLPQARRFRDLDVVTGELATPGPLDESVRSVSAPELIAAVEGAGSVVALPAPPTAVDEEGAMASG